MRLLKKRTAWNKGIKTGPNPEHSKRMKGHIPWNKGMKGCVNSGGFKKGHKGFHTIETREHLRKIMTGRSCPWLKGKKLSEETKEKMRLAHLGSKNHFFGKNHKEESKAGMSKNKIGKKIGEQNSAWKGGITPIYQKIRYSHEMDVWRNLVFKRDNFTCIICKDSKGGNLEAHHIKPFSTYEKLRFDINNGMTLCHICHINIHKK